MTSTVDRQILCDGNAPRRRSMAIKPMNRESVAARDMSAGSLTSPASSASTISPPSANNAQREEWLAQSQRLTSAVDAQHKIVDPTAARQCIQFFLRHASQISKEFLETTRFGAVINNIRKANAAAHVEISADCKKIVKIWQSHANRGTQPHGVRNSIASPGLTRVVNSVGHLKPVTPVDRFKMTHALTPPMPYQLSVSPSGGGGGSPNTLKLKLVRSANGSMVSLASTSDNGSDDGVTKIKRPSGDAPMHSPVMTSGADVPHYQPSTSAPCSSAKSSVRGTPITTPTMHRPKLRSTAEIAAAYNAELPANMQLSVETTPPVVRPAFDLYEDERTTWNDVDAEPQPYKIIPMPKATSRKRRRNEADVEIDRSMIVLVPGVGSPAPSSNHSTPPPPPRTVSAASSSASQRHKGRNWYASLPPVERGSPPEDDAPSTRRLVDTYDFGGDLRSRLLISTGDKSREVLAMPLLLSGHADFEEFVVDADRALAYMSPINWRYTPYDRHQFGQSSLTGRSIPTPVSPPTADA